MQPENSPATRCFPTKVRNFVLFLLFTLTSGISFFFGYQYDRPDGFFSPLSSVYEEPKARIYDSYSFDNLKKTTFSGSTIRLERVLTSEDEYTSYLFSFLADGKKVSGLANIPTATPSTQGFPVILQVRGFVDKEQYKTGVGTAPSAAAYAQQGFITLAPDFLGYGESDEASSDSLLERFENPAIVLTLLSSISSLPHADSNNVFLWGHSNGGQIALSVLEISGRPIPTVLWAPVTKPFPYSILYFTDESPDGGKFLRKLVADFENKGYDVERFSITSYFADITAPIQLHQGTADDAVPIRWSDQFNDEMKTLGKDITYYVYPDGDHNLRSSWDTVVERDIAFFRSYLK